MKKSATQRSSASSFWRASRRLLFVVLAMTCYLSWSLPAAAQDRVIRGKIVSVSGEPVIGASVNVKGGSAGAMTDAQGEFSIRAAKGAVLVISSVGYTAREVTVGDDDQLSIQLTPSAQEIGEVVVVGYGTQRKEAITGSVASISGARMREIPSPNISQALQGRIAGVEMSQTSTRPGATMQIRIRGVRSLTADNNPLIVLDGIPFVGSLADLNPNDIKSIDILKDASATAIYGSRGANGVILVTTDKGTRNGAARVNYSGYVGAQTVFAKYPMMDGPTFVKLRAARGQYVNGQDESDELNTDYQDLFYKTGIVTDQSISLSGGTATGTYNFGGGYYKNQAVIPTQQYTRYSLRGSLDQGVGKHFRFGFTTNNNYNISEGNQVGIYSILSMSPITSPYNDDGSLKRIIRMASDETYLLTKDVVERLHDDGQWLNETRGLASYNSVYGEVKAPFLDGLKYRVNLGLDYIQTNNGAFTGEGVNNTNASTISSASVDNRTVYHYALEHILSFDRTFGDKHTVNAVALYSVEQRKYNRSNMSAVDIPADQFQFYNLGRANGQITVDPNNQDYQLWGLMSYMGRVMYSYDNRYMISATVRSDGSSRLAPGHKWHTYPAVSAGWNIGNEEFMKHLPVVNSLKLRVGYGQTSNQAIDPYATLGVLSARPYNFGPTTYATGLYVTQIPNPSLGWEFSKTWNVGVDFSLLKNRLSGTIEYYITRTEDVLYNLGLPQTSGVSNINSNIGTTQNKGFELSLNGTILADRNGWTWEAGLNFYVNNNKLVSLASGSTRDEGNWWFVGHNINAIYDYKRIGLWANSKDSIDGHMGVLEPGGAVGMIRVEYTGEYDANGVPTRAIGPQDRQILDVDPDFQGGFNTSVSYKGFDLGVVGIFRKGGILFSTIHGSAGYLNLLTGRRNNIDVDYWTPENQGAKYPNPAGPISGDNPKYATTLSYFDASFLKIRTITLGYDFTRSLIKADNMKMRMYFTVQNPFVMFSPYHKESGLDPETNSFGNENVATTGPISGNQGLLRRLLTVGFNTPSTRNFVVGVNLTF